MTADDNRSVLSYQWTDDPRWLLYIQDDNGDPRQLRQSSNPNRSPTRELAPLQHALLPVNQLELRCEPTIFITRSSFIRLVGLTGGRDGNVRQSHYCLDGWRPAHADRRAPVMPSVSK